jgi:hypothetical protein
LVPGPALEQPCKLPRVAPETMINFFSQVSKS